MSTWVACLDACVIVPVGLCDTLLTIADAGIYRPVWSDEIFGEVRRTVARIRPGIPPADLEDRLQAMDVTFRGARVAQARVAAALPSVPEDVDVGDRHVVAAAFAGQANTIVTDNVDDFAADVLLDRFGITVLRPDSFLVTQFEVNPIAAANEVRRQLSRLRNPPRTPRQHIDFLRPWLPEFAGVLEEHLALLEAD